MCCSPAKTVGPVRVYVSLRQLTVQAVGGAGKMTRKSNTLHRHAISNTWSVQLTIIHRATCINQSMEPLGTMKPTINDSGPVTKRRRQHPSLHHSHVDRLRYLEHFQPLKTIISNLLECGQGELCGDEAYTSLCDLRADLNIILFQYRLNIIH